MSKGKVKGEEKGKGKGEDLLHMRMSKDTSHESVQLLNGKERAIIGSLRNSGRSTTLASSRSSGTTGARKFERQGQRPRPILWKRRCVRHRTGRFVQLSTAGFRQPHAVAA